MTDNFMQQVSAFLYRWPHFFSASGNPYLSCMNRLLLYFFVSLTAFSPVAEAQPVSYARLVNPFIGTGGHGHTFPGASLPFGMMQLSPDTRLEGWDGCSGYHYSDSLIYGFSHTHLSGTGIADYCDVLAMPFSGPVYWKNSDYRSPFSHSTEKANAGYYEVLLEKHRINAALTVSARSGMHQYTFPEGEKEGRILLDLVHRDEVLEASLEVVNEYEVRGMRRSRSWAQDQYVYFYIRFEQPIIRYELAENDQPVGKTRSLQSKHIKAWFGFTLPADRNLRMKIGISGVSHETARLNLDTEIPHWNFQQLQQEAEAAWNRELGKIEVKGGSSDEQVVFYTALYHASLAPNLYTDVNGQYRGTDLQVHTAGGFTNYTVFSLWDTYRALHPLMTILNRQRTRDWIHTFLAQYKNGGMLPVWELSGNETFCMIGYHAVPVIVDAWQKGIRDFDAGLALTAMRSYAESNRFGLTAYRDKGFIANNDDHESVSKTAEYAYDDWCIARFAGWLDSAGVRDRYLQRSLHYRNLFDPQTGFLRGKVQGFWFHPFDPAEVNNFYTEANAWQYAFAAQHDVAGLIRLHGGSAAFARRLNELFTTQAPLTGRQQADVTGLIGQYAHGNEPSHHMAYLFNHVGQPHRTQELVHRICREFYGNRPDGLIGNEDCGQMSAWYVLSALGFYPVTPGSGYYELGTPLFDEVILHLEDGNRFTTRSNRSTPGSFYVKGVSINGQHYPKNYLDHAVLAAGGVLEFDLHTQPQLWGSAPENRPVAGVEVPGFLPVPFFAMNQYKFERELQVVAGHVDTAANLYYRINEGAFRRYRKPFLLRSPARVELYAENEGLRSPVVQQNFYRIPTDRSIRVLSEVHPMYTAGGPGALIDGITGTSNWKTGEWQSYFGKDLEAVVDLKRVRRLNYLGVHVLQEVSPWILYPQEVQFEASRDGENFFPVVTVRNGMGKEVKGPVVQELGAAVQVKARYIRIRAVNGGVLPDWHESAGSPSHLFIDEVIIR